MIKDSNYKFSLMILLFIWIACAAVGFFYDRWLPNEDRTTFAVISFFVDLLVVTGLMGCIGKAACGSYDGIAINGLNQYSLSRAQMALWTILVLSAVSSFARIRLLSVFGPVTNPLDILIPGDLLAAMGIAAFTTIATPAVLALKSDQTPDDPGGLLQAQAKARAAAKTGGNEADFTSNGNTLIRRDGKSAAWIDMVLGDELANAGTIDISKVQQLLVTVLLVGAYLFLIVDTLGKAYCAPGPGTACRGNPLHSLPHLSQSFIALLALSHAGYLGYKVAPKAAPTPDPGMADLGVGVQAVTPQAADQETGSARVRLAIDDAASYTDLALKLDGVPQPIGADGLAEFQLDWGTAHRIDATGLRIGTPATGTMTIIPSLAEDTMLRTIALA